MAYDVFFEVPARQRQLGKADIKVTIFRDTRQQKSVPTRARKKGKLGDLLLSKGGVEWKGKHIRWRKLAELIENS
jgi:hypothetical protein